MKDSDRADWLSWAMQFVAGFIVGGIVGLIFIPRRGRSPEPIAPEAIPPLLLGAALIGAAIASTFGDRLWLGSVYRAMPPDAPRHSALSRGVSFVIGAVGIGFLVQALIRTFTS